METNVLDRKLLLTVITESKTHSQEEGGQDRHQREGKSKK